MFINAKLLIFSTLASLAILVHITLFKELQLKNVNSNVRMPCSPDGYLIQTNAPWNPFSA